MPKTMTSTHKDVCCHCGLDITTAIQTSPLLGTTSDGTRWSGQPECVACSKLESSVTQRIVSYAFLLSDWATLEGGNHLEAAAAHDAAADAYTADADPYFVDAHRGAAAGHRAKAR